MDFKNGPKKRTTNFREDETKLLIQLWGSPTVQNKLYLTHRKAPVMRLIAANMQRHGFYRTPDEIKTRIRNLKCLYHRIKKSMATGTGIGTVDPDWPHYKAMDDILSKKNALRQSLVYNQNLLSEISAESSSIKQEIEDIDINDDGESYTSNSNGSDDEFEETACSMPSTITPLIIEEEEKLPCPSPPVKIAPKPVPPPAPPTPAPPIAAYPRIQIAQNLLSTTKAQTSAALPTLIQAGGGAKIQTAAPLKGANNAAMPFPLLILNGMGAGLQNGANGGASLIQKGLPLTNSNNGEISHILKELLNIQKENLKIEKERLEVEKQKLEFERTVGSQLLNLLPMFNEIFQKFQAPEQPAEEVDTKNFEGHPNYNKGQKRVGDPLMSLRDGKLFKDAVVNGIKKYMNEGQTEEKKISDSR